MDVSPINNCNHEEADTRLISHSLHARQTGFKQIMIRTVDTDVVVLATAYERRLGPGGWLSFGTGKNIWYIPVHLIATKLTQDMCIVLPLFHALTGCDTVSAFHGKGKMGHGVHGNDFHSSQQI